MLNRTSQYALTTLGHLAGHRGERLTGVELARRTRIPANYLSKILNTLRKHGIVTAEKGWGGGFALHPKAPDLPILEIVMLLEGPQQAEPTQCLFGLPRCDGDNPCPLHSYWERIKQIHEDMLRNTRVRDLGRVPARRTGSRRAAPGSRGRRRVS